MYVNAVTKLDPAKLKFTFDLFSELLAEWYREADTGADTSIGDQTADFGTAA